MQARTDRELALELFRAALAAVDPRAAVRNAAPRVRELLEERGARRVRVLGFGKAAYAMALGARDGLAGALAEGAIVAPTGPEPLPERIGPIEVLQGEHPLPGPGSVAAGRRLLELARAAGRDEVVLALASGGGSSLLCAPAEGIDLDLKRRWIDRLVRRGADVHALNAVRGALSSIKAGRLRAACAPARVVTFVLSDVVGDAAAVVASGPTVAPRPGGPDPLDVLERYRGAEDLPAAVRRATERFRREREVSPDLPESRDYLVGSNGTALQAAAKRAFAEIFDLDHVAAPVVGPATDAGRMLAERALASRGRRRCVFSGGETVVEVRGDGRGGRSGELALAFAIAVADVPGVTLLSAGTDGEDGTSGAAGAIVDGGTVERGRARGLDPERALAENDSASFLDAAGDLLVTGPTGTNVGDVQILLTR